MTSKPAPPRLAARVVSAVLPPGEREAVLGDLEERYRDRLVRDGQRAASRWYWRQAITFVWRVPAERGGSRLTAPSVRPRLGTGLRADIRLGLRSLRRRPGLTLTVTLVLGLAIGASTTVFSVVKGVLIEQLPYPDPDRLVMLWDVYPPEKRMGPESPVTLGHVRAWSEQADLFSAVGAYESTSPSIDLGDWRERLDAALVTAPLLPMLGARPLHGRFFTPADSVAGAEPTVVLSHPLWVDRFGADPGLVGKSIVVNGQPARVVGVTSEDFWFYDPYSVTRSLTGRHASAAQLWMPLPDDIFGNETDYPRYRVIARLQPGLNLESAAEAAAIRRRQMVPTSAGDHGELRMLSLGEQVVAESRPRLLGLTGAVSLVLLIACVNLISLLLVHLDTRRSELAVRIALGAGRARLARQLIIESTLLALYGGAAGLALAVGGTRWLLSLVPRGLPLGYRVGLDPGVVAFGLGIAVLAGISIGAVTAMQLNPRQLAGTIAAGARSVAGSRRGRRLHGAFVGAEVTLSLILLISAALLMRGFIALQTTDTGFDARGVLTFEVTLESAPGEPPDYGFHAALEDEIAALPGISRVGTTSALPFSRWAQSAAVTTDGTSTDGASRVGYRLVSPGYFEAIGLDIETGRGFHANDRKGGPPVVVANRAFVDQWLDGAPSPVGRALEVRQFRETTTATIVGVVENVKHDRLFEADKPILYGAVRQADAYVQRFAVRVAAGDPMALVEPIRRASASINPHQSLTGFITFDDLVGQSVEEERFYAQVLGVFAAAAVLVTLVGLYGVVTYTTRQRDREVGIRLALGAGVGRVRSLVFRQAMLPVALGIGAGLAGALAASRLLQGLLHDVPATDPLSFLTATVVFIIVSSAACLLPARRASRVDPVQVLRGD